MKLKRLSHSALLILATALATPASAFDLGNAIRLPKLSEVTPGHVFPNCWGGSQCNRSTIERQARERQARERNNPRINPGPPRNNRQYRATLRVECYDRGEHWGHTLFTMYSPLSIRHAEHQALDAFNSEHLCKRGGRRFLTDGNNPRFVHR